VETNNLTRKMLLNTKSIKKSSIKQKISKIKEIVDSKNLKDFKINFNKISAF